VVDRYAEGAGSVDARLFGLVPMIHADDLDTTRSAAARTALEAAAFASPVLLAHPGVRWEACSDNEITATWDVPPERPLVRIRIDERGSVRGVSTLRWGKRGTPDFRLIPFGGDTTAERRFGPYVLPGRVTVGWWWGTPRYAPFFEAELLDVSPMPG
jgi:hypothetical protein